MLILLLFTNFSCIALDADSRMLLQFALQLTRNTVACKSCEVENGISRRGIFLCMQSNQFCTVRSAICVVPDEKFCSKNHQLGDIGVKLFSKLHQ